ncbi:dihydropteroate synthase [Xylanibacter muris]|uniref:dihydropteroate synthase n=1 Tax=Xylanibacter muris TaxID=2736290 RepID=A0ABX2ARN9_9BACT|nr:dihydropteroate synthase [Xylanibacter muris]NPD93212.1 dihydropteroate synthase [Xylanibacter muris]
MKGLPDYTINIRGRLISLSEPHVMGILNITPDSFYAGSRKQCEKEIAERANNIILEGGSIIDVGGFSTRPGATEVSKEEEMERMRKGLKIVRMEQPDATISVDTYRPDVARMAVEEFGADIINDVSEGGITGRANRPLTENGTTRRNGYPEMFRMAALLKVPYILMSVKPTVEDMLTAFSEEVRQLRELGVKDIILDPGFGFGKTLEQNYLLLDRLDRLKALGLPLLVGASRKSMIFKLLNHTPDESLNGTSVINTISLMKGASILRVHDVREAVECTKIVRQTAGASDGCPYKQI